MTRCLSIFFLASALASACGGGEQAKGPVFVLPEPTTADAGTSDLRRTAEAPDAAAEGGPNGSNSPRPAGANGPRDAIGLIGGAGEIVPTSAEAIMLVDMSEMRAHPKGPELARALVAALGRWNLYLPYARLHPLRDIDWALIAGSPASTEKNVLLVRHHLDDKRSEATMRELEKQLKGASLDLHVAGTASFVANVDGAERAYVRAAPGVLAIVPKGEARSVAENLRRHSVPQTVRKGELARILFTKPPPRIRHLIPTTIGPARAWIEADGANLWLDGESDSPSEDEAAKTAQQVRGALDGVHGLAAMMARPLLADAKVWADGRVARYRAPLDDTMLGLFSMGVCGSDASCGLPR